MFEKTGVDAIMIGRASIGNPWIFKEIQEYSTGQEINVVPFYSSGWDGYLRYEGNK